MIGGVTFKSFPCVHCALDTINELHVVCVICKKQTHLNCSLHLRFDEKGNYTCANCEPPLKLAKEKIYAPLKSELTYFIINYAAEEAKVLVPYGELVHENCGISDWPKQSDIETLEII